ncbi:MAG: NUDIX domain-containing protein, partial [Rhodospirillaceae bacterium]
MTLTTPDFVINEIKTVYQGYFRIDRYRLRHRTFNGGWSGEVVREVFERGHAVAVLLFDPDRDEVVMIEQFRVGAVAAGRPPWLLEVVAGIIGSGESDDEVARRETIEEAGCTVTDMIRIGDYLVSPGGTSETNTLFCARVDASLAGGIHGLANEQEDIRVKVMSSGAAIARLDADGIDNAATIIALGWLARHRDDIRRCWP